jgi:hypothetical protein
MHIHHCPHTVPDLFEQLPFYTGSKVQQKCERLKYQIKFMVQRNPIVFTAKRTFLGIRFISKQSQELLYGSHLYRGWALPLKRWDLCWT